MALLAVVFLTFRGSFPLSGNRESDDGAALRPNQASALPAPIGGTLGEGASRSRPGPGPEPEPTKLTGDDPAGGRSERLEWLIANDHYAEAGAVQGAPFAIEHRAVDEPPGVMGCFVGRPQ